MNPFFASVFKQTQCRYRRILFSYYFSLYRDCRDPRLKQEYYRKAQYYEKTSTEAVQR
jgi:hypothetical protein